MEARIRRFQELAANPWANVMNWVLDELRTPPQYRRSYVANTGCFYNVPKHIRQR